MPFRLTPAVKALLIACFATFLIQQTADQYFGANLKGLFALVPAGFVIEYRFWQLFTYVFLHDGVMHLFFNLLMLAFIGGELEGTWGTPRFLRYFFFCSSAAGVVYLFIMLLGLSSSASIHSAMLGASGGIYGLLMAYGLIFGERVLLFMLLFPMKAKHFVWILAGVEFMTTLYSQNGALSSVAHLSGMFAGFAYLWVRASWAIRQRQRKARKADPNYQRKKRLKKSKNHLKLIIDNEKNLDVDPDGADQDPKTWH